MNIFFTDFDVNKCALNHCKVHVNKMIIEYAQLLSTAHHQLDDSVPVGIYRESHVNHPSAVWVRQARGNYQWLFKLLTALCTLYKQHKFIDHATASVLPSLKNPPKNIPSVAFFEPPQCMPDEYKQKNTCKAYKNYLQSKYDEWQARPKPIKVEFYNDGCNR